MIKLIRLIGHISLMGLIVFVSLRLTKTASAEEAILPTPDQPETTALTIAPSIHEAVVAPGKTTSQIFEIKNGSNFPLPIKYYIRTFDANDEVGGVAISEEVDAARFSPGSWSQIVEPDFVLQPQSTR